MELIEQLKQSLQPIVETVFPYLKEGWGVLNDYAYLRALILVFIIYVIARFLNKHIPHLLVELAKKIKFSLGESFAKLTAPLIFQVIFLTGIGIVAGFLGLSETEYFIALASIKSLLIIFFIVFIYKLIKLILEYLCQKEGAKGESKIIQPATLPLFENIVLLFLVLAGIHQVFGVWNIDMTALLASAGIVGLAIGMASKDTLSDVIAGILILTDTPYRVGDVIQIGTAVGTITSIGIRSTRIITKDNVGITVPNGKMGASEVINESTADDTSLRIKLPIKAAYGINPDIIRDILVSAAHETKQVLKDKKIKAVLSDFQQEQITFTLLCWVAEPKLKSSTLSALREKIYSRFLEDNIAIAAADKREIEITKQPERTQRVAITAIPPLDQSIAVKEIPNLFGSGPVRKILKPESVASSLVENPPEPLQQDKE